MDEDLANYIQIKDKLGDKDDSVAKFLAARKCIWQVPS
jgi:hypothetical protein